MKKVLVTGATGFVGSNLARALIRDGFKVKCLVRKTSNTANIDDMNVEVEYGDLTDKQSVVEALDGCEGLFHTAAYYKLWVADPKIMYDINVEGTKNVMAAALERGLERVVYTSSVATLKVPDKNQVSDETCEPNPDEIVSHYKKSKYLAEVETCKIREQGLPVVIVNPSTPIGPGDIKPTPTGQIVLDFIKRKMPAYVNTGLNIIDVEDCAAGHILAYKKGVVGERYILGNKNVTLREILDILSDITGLSAPRVRIPISIALLAAYVDQFISTRLLNKPPNIPVSGVKMARKFMWFDSSRAVRELGLPQNPIENAFRKSVQWYKEHGYV